MVDTFLLSGKKANVCRWLITDLNGSFAAMEQDHDPALRGRPVGITPVLTDTSWIVASSWEAKKDKVKCGVSVADAKRMCRDLIVMEATPGLYSSYQKRMKEVLEDVHRVEGEPNVDEFRFRLIGDETAPENARQIARRMKLALRDTFSPAITMSAGIAPNAFYAKAATNLQKYDGLVVITASDIPHALGRFSDLTEIVGISTRMKIRLNAHGIFTVRDLTTASKRDLFRVWGGLVGERWWYQLHGYDVDDEPTRKGSLGHSHVLPRERRNPEGVKAIALRLLGKAAARLRSEGYWASGLWVSVSGRESWERHQHIPETQDDRDLIPLVSHWLNGANYSWPLKVSVNFYQFRRREAFTPSLFENEPEWGLRDPGQEPHEPNRFGAALDATNNAWGKHKIFVARIKGVRQNAREKIAFQKKDLFREGRGDDLPPWDGIIPLSPLQRLEREVAAGESLTDLAAYLCGGPARPDGPVAEGDLEEAAFRLIGERLAATLAEPGIVHRAELRLLVVRILRRLGYRQREAEIAAEMIFADARPPDPEIQDDPFPDMEQD